LLPLLSKKIEEARGACVRRRGAPVPWHNGQSKHVLTYSLLQIITATQCSATFYESAHYTMLTISMRTSRYCNYYLIHIYITVSSAEVRRMTSVNENEIVSKIYV